MSSDVAKKVRELHAARNYKIELTRAGESFLLHVTDAGVSRWMELTREEAQDLCDALRAQLSQ